MRVLIIAPDEDSISPQQAVEQARNTYGSYATIVPLPSANNVYAQLYFCAQSLVADQLLNIMVDSKDETYYNIAKEQLMKQALVQFQQVLNDVESNIKEKLNK